MSLDVNFPGSTTSGSHSDNGRLIEGKKSNIKKMFKKLLVLVKFVYDFKPEWEIFFESFDDYGISCIQFFSAKKNSITHKIFGTFFHLISLILTCKSLKMNLFYSLHISNKI